MTAVDKRPIAPISIEGITPGAPATQSPSEMWVAPSELLVDAAYQRDLSDRSMRLIRKIVADWDWRRFKPPVVAMTDAGFECIDGQHTAIAAASHPAIDRILVVVVDATEQAARASAFIGHNRDRLAMTPTQLHNAAVVAGEAEAIVIQVTERAGIRIRAARAEQANRDLTRDRDRWKNLAESRSEEMLVDFDAAARACKAMRDAGAVYLILDPAPCLRSVEFMRVALTHFRDELAGGRR